MLEIDLEAVVSGVQVCRQRQVAQHVPLAILLMRPPLGKIPGMNFTRPRSTATLELHRPAQQGIVLDGGSIHPRHARTGAQHDHIS
jgi:hypothetical protein